MARVILCKPNVRHKARGCMINAFWMLGFVYYFLSRLASYWSIKLAIAFIAIGAGVYLVFWVRVAWARMKLARLVRDMMVSDLYVGLPCRVDYETGIYRCIGDWELVEDYRGRRSRKYFVTHKFTTETTGSDRSVKLPQGTFLAIAKRVGAGILGFPAIKFLSEPYRDLLVLVMTPKGEVTGRGRLEVAHENRVAAVEYKGSGTFLTGECYSLSDNPARMKVEIAHKSRPEIRARVGRGKSFEFSRQLLPDDVTVFIARKELPLKQFSKLMGNRGVVMGHGRYAVRLILDLRFRKDVSKEAEFEVVPELEA